MISTQCRFALEKQQKVIQRGFTRFRGHARVNGFNKFEIIGRIDGQPPDGAGQSGIGFCAGNRHEIRMKLEISRDMFSGDGIVRRIHHQLVQGTPGHRVDTFVRGFRAFFEQNVIPALFDHRGQQMIDEIGIDKWCIR